MKKIILILGFSSFILSGFIACSSDDNNPESPVMTSNDLPANAKSIVSTYFSSASVKSVKQNTTPNIYNSIYAAYLNNGIEIDFDKNGNWTEIESETNSALPENFLSQEVPQIHEYVKTNYPSNWITSVEKGNYGFSVDLNNGLELLFNQSQTFVGIDVDKKDNEEVIYYSALPQTAKSFIETNFASTQPVHVKKEIDNNQTFYKVYLSTGYKVEFDSNGNWTEIESKGNAGIPSGLVPASIQSYVTTNYNGYTISSIEKEVFGYQVEIVSGKSDIDLKFDTNGNFLGIDS